MPLFARTLLPLLLLAQEPAPVQTPVAPGPQVGQPAPSFRVNDHSGKATSVGGAAATWTVLAFFPKAATPG